MEFERENEIMDERQEMMDDAIDEATGIEDEEESEDIVKEVLDEIGVDLGQAVSFSSPSFVPLLHLSPHERLTTIQFGETPTGIDKETVGEARVAQAIGGGAGEDDDL